MPFELMSPSFGSGAPIPPRHTCDGRDVSPPLVWTDPPDGTKSFVLVVDDPDAPDPKAPQRVWVHWVLYDIPPAARGLPEGVTRPELPPGAKEGRNDWHRKGYRGPAPPIGRHRYFFTLHALDAPLGELHDPTRQELDARMNGHVLATATLMGTYEREPH